MNNLAVVLARGGSKRIPRKNIQPFLGKPILSYSIDVAIRSGIFNEIIVSTDDHEIAKVGMEYGAKVPFLRSDEASDDKASTFSAVSEVISEFAKMNLSFDTICCIYPTAPLITTSMLEEAYNILLKTNCYSVFPIVPYSYPVQRSLRLVDERVKFAFPENSEIRSQDLEAYYHDAGQFYFSRPENLLSGGSMWTDNSKPLIISEIAAQDIDNISDWKIAEMKYKLNFKI